MPTTLPPLPSLGKLRANEPLSGRNLRQALRTTLARIPEHRNGRLEFSLVDTIMSAAAVLGLKFPSLLKFDENRHEAHLRHNLGTLYGVEGQVPGDTPMRTILDRVEPEEIGKGLNTLPRMHQRLGELKKFN